MHAYVRTYVHVCARACMHVCMYVCTLEPRMTVTSLVRLPHHWGHHFAVPNCIPQCNLAPCNTVTSPLRSLLPSPMGDRIREVPLYVCVCVVHVRACIHRCTQVCRQVHVCMHVYIQGSIYIYIYMYIP